MSLVVLFPAGKEASADAYLTWCNSHNPDTTPGAIWYMPDRVDAHGQRVVGYLGPGFMWNGEDFPEPVGGPAARADGVLSTTVDWPIEDI